MRPGGRLVFGVLLAVTLLSSQTLPAVDCPLPNPDDCTTTADQKCGPGGCGPVLGAACLAWGSGGTGGCASDQGGGCHINCFETDDCAGSCTSCVPLPGGGCNCTTGTWDNC